MLKYFLYTIKNNTSYNKLIYIYKNGLQTNTSKIDDIAFRGGAHTQQGSRKLNLNLTGSESHPQLEAINFTR